MNERIRELAEQAGYSKDFLAVGLPNNMEKFAELIRADEREACATVCENDESGRDSGGYYAEIIRARGEE